MTRSWVRGVAMLAGLGALVGALGCSDFRPKILEKHVYVTAKQTYLRDRVAAVSNRTGTASNGEELVVLDHARRFIKVRTPRGEVGWIEEKLTAGQDVADKFVALGKEHEKDPVVAKATARDEVYLHISPGRNSERFYRLAENDPLSLLKRATIVKPVTPGQAPAPKPILSAKARAAAEAHPEEPEGPPMEDWWLVRDAKGQTGWIYSRMIDVSAPDALARYAEGQRIVGAYLLAMADDPDSGVLDNGNVVTRIPEYVTVLSPYKAGLAYDFDQVRVFIWNVKKHRYETGFRERNVAGYLPVTIGTKTDPNGKGEEAQESLPSFSYRVLAADQGLPVPDPKTGEIKPGRTIVKTYRLEGNICRQILPPGMQAEAVAHPHPVAAKKERVGKKVKVAKKVKVGKKRKR
jgi:SH3-like domain-containing protein